MLLQQLASIFLCSQFPSPSDVQHTLGLHCGKEGCREFLQCQALSNTTCSCFLHKGMKAFSCPSKHFVVSESGSSAVPEAIRVSCYTLGPHRFVKVPLAPPIHPGNSVTIIGKLVPTGRPNFIIYSRRKTCLWMRIQYKPKMFTSPKGQKSSQPSKTFPFKLGKTFELKLLFRQDGYEVLVDDQLIFSNPLLPTCTLETMDVLSLYNDVEIHTVHFNYNE